MSNFQTRYDVLPGGSFVLYSDTIPSSLGTGITANVGDKCLNIGSSGPTGWVCTVAGSPGTWNPIGQGDHYIASETGANNAIAGSLPGVVLTPGISVTVKLAHTLQAGANTFALNGGTALAIKSHFNVASNIATAYASTGYINLVYDGTEWLDMSQ